MDHAFPIYRSVQAFVPSSPVSRERAAHMLDEIQKGYAELEQAMSLAAEKGGATKVRDPRSKEEPRRRQARTEILDLPEMHFTKGPLSLSARTCLTACGARVGNVRQHKVWTRLSLVNHNGKPATALDFDVVADFFSQAASLSRSVADGAWAVYAKTARKSDPKMDFSEAGRLTVKFFETPSEEGARVEALFDAGASVDSVLRDAAGARFFSELVALEPIGVEPDAKAPNATLKARTPEDDAREIRRFLDQRKAEVFQYHPPSVQGSAICVQVSNGDRTSIIGAGPRSTVEEEERCLSFEGSRTLTAMRGAAL